MKKRISRRQFISNTVVSSAALGAVTAESAGNARPSIPMTNPGAGAWVRWLDGVASKVAQGVTWGTPWPRGHLREGKHFALRGGDGKLLPLQSWPLAYWPDGSLKWTAHAFPPTDSAVEGPFEVIAQRTVAKPSVTVVVKDTDAGFEIDTGKFVCRLPRSGSNIVETLTRGGREGLREGKLVLLRQDRAASADTTDVRQELFESSLEKVTVEQRGPVRAVVKLEGKHSNGKRGWLPFTLRLYFYAGSDALRILHTIVFDGDEAKDFVRGIGLRFSVPMSDVLHDRHVRFAGEQGLFAEAVRGLTGLRRDPGQAARQAQIDGTAVPSINPAANNLLQYIPAFGDWTLLQPNANSFTIRKRTADGHAWLDSAQGHRASGLAYVGGPAGGVAFGIRNFWQSHPAQLDIRHAHDHLATVTMWVWAPESPPMDLRFYHDGLGMDTHEKQIKGGLEITYEDYEPGFGTPLGVARTSELMLWMLPSTPSRERTLALAKALQEPAVMVPTPKTSLDSGVFGHSFSLPSQTPPEHAQLEQRLEWMFDFYRSQQDQRGWYGFWNYGDVMHTYDFDRHEWRYDVGGYAWDNSELATDFLRTGRADTFRFAEAMTRHTGEVDVHHLGRFAPLGSRHNVMHWGCSAKQLRISTALNRRYYYYLTGDERVGDLMREQNEAARTLRSVLATRKLPGAADRQVDDPNGDFAFLGFGTDWGSLAGAWLTEWERTRDPKMRDRLVSSMKSIAAQPKGFFTGGERMNLITGQFDISRDPTLDVSHLSAAFGLPEVCAELIELLEVPEFERAWLLYCELYNGSDELQKAALGESFGRINLEQGHARLTAYAAYRKKDAALAARAWKEFTEGRSGYGPRQAFTSNRIEAPAVLTPVDEVPGVSTNATAQWGLAAIECLAYARAPD
jgi:hypothetical protein